MKSINFKVIPHKEQRYDTVGDYWETKNIIQFRVSDLGDWRMELLVFIHEVIEYAWAKLNKVSMKTIDDFDIRYEEDRLKGKYTLEQEPGFDPDCPVYKGHSFADAIERLVAFMLDVKWSEYNNKVNSL